MPKESGLPGSSLPLDPNIQVALDAFNDPVTQAQLIRAAAAIVLFEDLKDDVAKAIKASLGN